MLITSFGAGKESEKLQKRDGSMVQGQVFLKWGEGWHFSCLIFSNFIIFTFTNYFTLSKIAIYLKKNYFLLPP